MFGKPTDYLFKAAQVLSIELGADVISDYVEAKASRDIIVHNLGRINRLYVDKAREKARGGIGDQLVVDLSYFHKVVTVTKILADRILQQVSEVYS